MRDENDVRDAVRAAFEALEAVPYPEMVLRSMPVDFHDPEVAPKIQELATLSMRLPELGRIALREKIFKHVKGLPRIPGRKIFDDRVRELEQKAAGAAVAAEGEKRPKRAIGKARGHVTTADGCYWREGATGEKERFTNFVFVPTHRIVRHDKGDKTKRAWVRARILGPELEAFAVEGNTTRVLQHEHVIPGDAWNSKRAFVQHLPSGLVVNGGGDDDVMGIYELFMREYDYENLPELRSTPTLGRHTMPDGTIRYVETWGTIGPDGLAMEIPDLIYLPEGGNSYAYRLPHKGDAVVIDSESVRAMVRTFCETVFRLNDPAKVGAILGWSFGTLFGPDLRNKLAGGPILNIAATQQSGKSSLIGRVFWAAFLGVTGHELMSSNPTAFALTKDLASLASGFLALDELRSDMGASKEGFLYRMLRKTYTGETESRGQADLSVKTFALNAFVCLCGEERIDGDPALNTRCVFVELDGNYLREHPDAREAFAVLDDLPLYRIAPFLHAWTARADVGALVTEAKAIVEATLVHIARKNVDTRMRSNLAFVAIGLLAFDAVARFVGADEVAMDFNGIAAAMIASANDEDEDDTMINPDSRPRTALDLARIDWGLMVGHGVLREGRDWGVIDGEERWWVEGCEVERAKWLIAQGKPASTLKMRAFWRVAREMQKGGGSHVVGVRVPFSLDGDTKRRVLALDPAKFPATLRLDTLPANDLRSHGGPRTPADLLALWNKGSSKDPGKWGGS